MNLNGVPTLRYVVAPTTKEIYDSDKASYDALDEIPTLDTLSNENDTVDGFESLYGYVLQRRQYLPIDSVTGNEGFISFIKTTVKVLLVSIKNFFKWVWSFFGSKEKTTEIKSRTVGENLLKYGVNTGEIPYPKTTAFIYPTKTRPANNLNWLSASLTNMVKGVDKAQLYIDKLNKFVTPTISPGKEFHELLSGKIDAYQKEVNGLFGNSGKPVNFLSVNDIRLSSGRLTYEMNGQSTHLIKGATFQTTDTQVKTLYAEYSVFKSKLSVLTKSITGLERGMVKTVEFGLELVNAAGKEPAKSKEALSKLRNTINTSMGNIKVLETALYRGSSSVLAIINNCVKKG